MSLLFPFELVYELGHPHFLDGVRAAPDVLADNNFYVPPNARSMLSIPFLSFGNLENKLLT